MTGKDSLRWNSDAMELLHYATEHYMVSVLEQTVTYARVCKRKSIMPKDIQMVQHVRDEFIYG